MNMHYDIPTFIGFVGAVLILVAYFLNQLGKWPTESRIFAHSNLWGSVLLIISLIWHWNIGAFLISTFWAGISIKALLNKKA